MKNWFNNLKDKYKLFLIVGLYIGSVLFSDAVPFLCLACLAFAIIFTVYYNQHKKSKQNEESQQQKISTPKIVLENERNKEVEIIKKPDIDIEAVFPKIYDDCVLRWCYKENIAMVQNLDKVEFEDRYIKDNTDIKLIHEHDNQYDENAVALYKDGDKLGYFYKGQTRKMILDYLNSKNYLIKTYVCLLDRENNKLAVAIAFYQKLDSIKADKLTLSLTKIHKKATDFGSSRHENVSLRDVGDYVELSDNYNGSYTVYDEYWNELGELSAKKIEDVFDNIIYAKIEDIKLVEDIELNESYKVKISIFYR